MKKVIIHPPTFLLICLLLEVGLHFVLPVFSIPWIFRPVGLVFVFFGILVNLRADRLFTRGKTTVKPDGTPTAMVTSGPFRYSRHPMYLGFVLILIGVAIMLGSVSALFIPVLMFILLEFIYIPQEEKRMEECFGQEYLEYKKRVRRWI